MTSFHFPSGADARTEAGRLKLAQAYAAKLSTVGTRVGAITDYNGIRTNWFPLLRDEAAKLGVVLLPGVEMSFQTGKHGLHVLAIFEAGTDFEQINAFLRGLDRDSATPLVDGTGHHRDIESKEPLAEALDRLRDRFGCLLIFPHPDGTNGICKSLQSIDAAKLLREASPDGLEHCPDGDVRKLISTAILDSKFFNRLSLLEFSDNHGIDDIGSKKLADGGLRRSYLKLSATDLDALRLALHDPETRLHLGHVPQPIHARIRSMTVIGSGFLGNQVINWNDDLTVLIGGRGSGKSAVIETLRYALGLTPYTDGPYRLDLVKHALGSGGVVELMLERPVGNGNTRGYVVRRVWGQEPEVLEAETRQPVDIKAADVLGPSGGPTIFGQREIYAVSANEGYRIALLDQLIGEDARSHAEAVQLAIDQLVENAQSIGQQRAKLAKREEYRQKLKGIEHELSIYEKQKAAEKLTQARTLRTDGQYLVGASQAMAKLKQGWRPAEGLLNAIDIAERRLQRGESSEKAILKEASTVVRSLRDGINGLFHQVDGLLEQAQIDLEALKQRWQVTLKPLEEAINQIKREAQTESLDPDRLLNLAEEKAAFEPLIEELGGAEDGLNHLVDERRNRIREVRDRRLAEHKLRRERAQEISGLLTGRLRLEVEFKGMKDGYKSQLQSALKGSGMTQDAIDRLVTPDATDGIALVESIRAGSTDLQQKFSLTPGMADRLVNWGSTDESRLFDLERIVPADVLRVELEVDGKYRGLDRLSAGQRATAILLLLFALEGRVMVLDQPEDDLDNRFVYEDVVQMLREQKGIKDLSRRRQVIAASHNANIPVLGDAELVLPLEVENGQAHVAHAASIDDIETRDLVKKVMEGGEEAFLLRAQKYGGIRLS